MNKEEEKERFYNQRSDKFSIVLNDNELNLFKSSKNIVVKLNTLESLSPVYIACIKHDLDRDEKTNQLKTLHYHLVIHLNKICRVKSMINVLMTEFKCNENQISIQKCNSLCMQSRYLIHLDELDKHIYLASDIVCNKDEVLNGYLNKVIVRDLHDLITVVRKYNYDLEQIMIAISNYDKWRKYINDLIINYNRKRF